MESNPEPDSPQQSPNMSNPGRLSSVLTPIKRLFGGAPTPEPQEGPLETQETTPPDPPANEAEYYITLGKTTLHDWQPNPHNRGVLHRGTTYQDMAPAMARKELYQDILATQPWNVDLSDSVTSLVRLFPNHKARPDSSIVDALNRTRGHGSLDFATTHSQKRGIFHK